MGPIIETMIYPPQANRLSLCKPHVPEGYTGRLQPSDVWLVKVNHRSTAIPDSREFLGRAVDWRVYDVRSLEWAEEIAKSNWDALSQPQRVEVRVTFGVIGEEGNGA